MSADIDTQAEQLWRQSREAQGLPLVVDDDKTIDKVAQIIRPTADERREQEAS